MLATSLHSTFVHVCTFIVCSRTLWRKCDAGAVILFERPAPRLEVPSSRGLELRTAGLAVWASDVRGPLHAGSRCGCRRHLCRRRLPRTCFYQPTKGLPPDFHVCSELLMGSSLFHHTLPFLWACLAIFFSVLAEV